MPVKKTDEIYEKLYRKTYMNIRGGGCMETGVNSDILGYLKKRQSELEKVSHPMVRYDDSNLCSCLKAARD